MQKAPEYTIVIPNYNGLKYMENCMAALKKQSYSSFVVLIVDNGSTDGSREYIEKLTNVRNETENENQSSGSGADGCREAGELTVKSILLDTNTGFSGAVNVGLAAAETESVILLNNDTEADPDYVREIAAVFDKDEEGRIAAVSPKMIQLYHKDLLDDAGDGYNLLGWAFQRGVGQPVGRSKFNIEKNVFSACAGAAAYRKSVLEEIKYGGNTEENAEYFDLLHFAYLEDLDVSFRARIHGYDIVYAPKSVVYHVGSGTSGSKYNSFKVRLAARNNVYLNYKNMPLLMLVLNLPGILAGVLVKQLFFIKRGFGREYAGGFAEGIRTLGKCRSHKTAFRLSRLPVYIKIEWMLICDTFSYIQDFLVRHL